MTDTDGTVLGSISPDEALRLHGRDVIRCPECAHGIDPHGTNPGDRCGVGDESGKPCQCMMSPNGIASALLAESRRPRHLTDDQLVEVAARAVCRTVEARWTDDCREPYQRIARAVLAAAGVLKSEGQLWALCDRDWVTLMSISEDTKVTTLQDVRVVATALAEGQDLPPVMFAYPLTAVRSPHQLFVLVHTTVEPDGEGWERVEWTFVSLNKLQGDYMRRIGASV